jgi:AraC family transcriptional regulator, transcriptional activator of pobA
MNSELNVPIIHPDGMDSFHFGGMNWPFNFSKDHKVFHINRIEDYRDKLSFPLPPHRKTVYDLIFLTKGTSVRSKGLGKFELNKGQFFFLPPYQITSHEKMSNDAEGFFMHFDVSIFKDFNLEKKIKDFTFYNFLANPVITIPESRQIQIINILTRIEEIESSDLPQKLHLIGLYVFTLLTEVSLYAEPEISKPKNAASIIVEKYKEALSQYIYQKQKVSEYADYLNVTPNHLNKCVKIITKKSSQDLLNEMMIMEAKSLLKYSNLQIAEIAIKLGNQNPSNFARFFKSKTGLMPKEYK